MNTTKQNNRPSTALRARIKPGYKQTPVGIIPEDWEVKGLDELGNFYKGKGISKSQLVEDGLNAIRYGEIYTVHHFYIKEFYSFIDSETAKQSFKLEKGDILFAGSGETAEEIGKSVAFIGEEEAYASGDIIVLRVGINGYNSKFLGFITNHDVFRSQAWQIGQGNSVVHIYSSGLKNIQLPIPPLPEQKAIAACLSTWDSGIEELNQLIQAKKQQKKGLMQQLLTGEKRLPGFEGEWEEVKIKDISKKKSSSLQANSLEEKSGIYPVYGATGFLTKIDFYEEEEPYIGIVKDGSGVGNMYFLQGKSSVLGTLDKILPKNSNLYFLYGILKRLNFGKYKVGGAIPHIYYKDYSNEKALVPTLKEQTAIAEILQTADQEIELLEQKLSAFQQQKKGLMQVLLTGEKRLV